MEQGKSFEEQGLPSPEQRNIKLDKTVLILGLESIVDQHFDQIELSWLIAVTASQRAGLTAVIILTALGTVLLLPVREPRR